MSGSFLGGFNVVFNDTHYWVDAHHNHRNYMHHLRKATTQAEMDEICTDVEGVDVYSAIGYWLGELIKDYQPRFNRNEAGLPPLQMLPDVCTWAAARWGAQVSQQRKEAVKDLLIRTYRMSNEGREAAWVAFEDTLNDFGLTWKSGRATLISDGMPRHILAEQTFMFDAPITVRLNNIQTADTVPAAVCELDVPPNFKTVISCTDGTNTETIENNAEQTYTLSGADFNAQFDKLEGLYRNRELTLTVGKE